MLATATVLSFCTVTATPLPFGNDTTTAPATVGVLCTSGTPYNVALRAGTRAAPRWPTA